MNAGGPTYPTRRAGCNSGFIGEMAFEMSLEGKDMFDEAGKYPRLKAI